MSKPHRLAATGGEKQRFLSRTRSETALSSTTIHGLFEAQAEMTPEAPAVRFEGAELTYGDLNRRSNQLAHHLRALGVGPESLVGICLERSDDMVAALFGILKAGGAYVPLDPGYPRERLAFMLQDAGAPIVVTQQNLLQALPSASAHIVCVDRDGERIATESEGNPEVPIVPGNLAYVIYTSGSTGVPKGVQVEHRSVVNFLHAMRELLAWGPSERSLFVTMLSFDIAGLEVYLPLSVGAGLEVCSRAVAADPKRLGRALQTSVTAMQATPATWRMLVDSGWSGHPGLKVLCGGEAMPWDLAKELLERSALVWNLYGPTETTIWSAAHRVERQTSERGVVPIGRPIARTQLYVLDEEGKPAPVGTVGELLIGGDGLARGYLHRPDLTAERFVPDPWGGEAGKRIYRTGDLARCLPDGTIEFLGRRDEQVKVRGYRVELGEIEAVLRQHPSVAQAVVVGRGEEGGQTRLVAYVVGASEVPSVQRLRDFLGKKLPEYMIPSVIMFLRELPLTPNRKVDRRALPAPGGGRPELSRPYVSAGSVIERRLIPLWEEVLQVAPIGVRDDFFELGGHSLQAARLFSRIEKVFRRDFPPTILFRATTIEELSRILSERPRKHRWTSLVPIQPEGTRPPLFGIHGGAGTILFFQGLTRYLGTDQPFYGLQARGLYGGATPQTRVEDMAEHYVAEIRQVQPHGPYFLIGFCGNGGLVAFEMARRLRAEGEQIALLAGINAMGPVRNPLLARRRPSATEALQQKVTSHRKAAHSLGAGEKLIYYARAAARSLGSRSKRLFRRTFRKISTRALLAARQPLPADLREVFFASIAHRAAVSYVPEVYPGRMVHFRAEAIPSQPEYADPQLGWQGFASGGLEIHIVPGVHENHRTIMDEPAVRTLGAQVAAVLARTQAGAQASARVPRQTHVAGVRV